MSEATIKRTRYGWMVNEDGCIHGPFDDEQTARIARTLLQAVAKMTKTVRRVHLTGEQRTRLKDHLNTTQARRQAMWDDAEKLPR